MALPHVKTTKRSYIGKTNRIFLNERKAYVDLRGPQPCACISFVSNNTPVSDSISRTPRYRHMLRLRSANLGILYRPEHHRDASTLPLCCLLIAAV